VFPASLRVTINPLSAVPWKCRWQRYIQHAVSACMSTMFTVSQVVTHGTTACRRTADLNQSSSRRTVWQLPRIRTVRASHDRFYCVPFSQN